MKECIQFPITLYGFHKTIVFIIHITIICLRTNVHRYTYFNKQLWRRYRKIGTKVMLISTEISFSINAKGESKKKRCTSKYPFLWMGSHQMTSSALSVRILLTKSYPYFFKCSRATVTFSNIFSARGVSTSINKI